MSQLTGLGVKVYLGRFKSVRLEIARKVRLIGWTGAIGRFVAGNATGGLKLGGEFVAEGK